MKAEDVDAGLVARAEAAREDALRKWHIKFRAGQQTEPGHVLGMRAALAAVLPEIQAQAWADGHNQAVATGAILHRSHEGRMDLVGAGQYPTQSRNKHADVAQMIAELVGVSSAYDSTFDAWLAVANNYDHLDVTIDFLETPDRSPSQEVYRLTMERVK